jgi:hypothetical protein
MSKRQGGCLCGEARYEVTGEPLRVGICHCLDCRKESGSAFACYAIYPADALSYQGEIRTYQGRSFCPLCGGRLFTITTEEAEIRFGSLEEAPTNLAPSYELWVRRRERWLDPLPGAEQFDGDRPS